ISGDYIACRIGRLGSNRRAVSSVVSCRAMGACSHAQLCLRRRFHQMAVSTSPSAQQTLSVAPLTAQIKNKLEGEFTSVWVVGEISNYARPQSGHSYFALKDDQAQIRAVMWRSTAAKLKFDVADGLDVVCHGHLDVYAPRGSYQLVVDELQPKGLGALELALRKLREKLAAEGLFDPARKRKLPAFPRDRKSTRLNSSH